MTAVRIATIEDLDQVRSFGRRVLPEFYESIGLLAYGQAHVTAYWESDGQATAIEQGAVILAELDDELVGVAEVGRWEGEPILYKLYVDPDARGQSIGPRLIEAAMGLFGDRETSLLVEHPSENERAARFYQRHGFDVFAVEEGEGPGATTIWRRRNLV